MATTFTVKQEKKISVSATELTVMQEKATAFVLKRAYKEKAIFTKVEDIVKDKITRKGLQEIFVKSNTQLLSYDTPVDIKSTGGSWLNNFFQQHKKMLNEYKAPGWTLFDRDDKGGFMAYITNLVKTKFNIQKKDSWNPADIWLIKSNTGNYPSKYRKQIEEAMEGAGATQTLAELNVIMRAMFKANEIVGISLKKISGQSAKYERVNTDEKFFKNLEKQTGIYSYSFSGAQIKLGLTKRGEFENVNTFIYLKDSTNQQRFTFQIQGNTTSRASNLKFDAKDIKSGAALIGKVPLDLLEKLAKKTKGIPNDIWNSSTRNRYHLALNLKDFKRDKTKYVKMFNNVKRKAKGNPRGGKPVGECKDDKEFVYNMETTFNSKDERTLGSANSKLLQLFFLDRLMSAPVKARDAFVTDMIFLAAKVGRKISDFGPFGKLY